MICIENVRLENSGPGLDPREGGSVAIQQREVFDYLFICTGNTGLEI